MVPKNVQVAFRVYSNDWGLRGHGSRQIDWLVDGTKLHRENVLFVIDQKISHEYKKALESKYRVYDASRKWHETSDRIRWWKFTEQWQPQHWVSYNDYHPRHKIRNLILCCQTWHYSHSLNMPKEQYQPWHELNYDHLVFNSEVDAAYFTGGQKHILGPLFSSQVPQTVVAVFDSTWAHYPDGTQDKFFAGLYELLDRHPSMVMLYKPKHKLPPIWFERPHKNFYTLPEWIEPGLVIGCADATISLYGASTTMEAQGAGKTAFWFNPWIHSHIDDFKTINPPLKYTAADRFRELLLK
mgnify:CR=1 FL=1